MTREDLQAKLEESVERVRGGEPIKRIGELGILRGALRMIAQTIGEPGLELDPERLAVVVSEKFEALRDELQELRR